MLGSTHTTPVDDLSKTHVAHLISKGEMIEAVKFVKDRFHVSLKEAKDIVEGIQREGRRNFGRSNSRIGIPKSNLANRILLFCCILGLAFVSIAAIIYIRQARSVENSELVTGIVVDFNSNRNGLTAPVIEYEWNGQVWLFASKTYSSFTVYALDEEVPLYVNREDATDVIVDTVMDRWLVVFVFGTLGVSFVAIPVWVYRVLNGR